MAQTNNVAILRVIANMKAKFAELDTLDNEFADLDATFPEGEGIEQFNLLSDKREELEQEIRSMRERVQLISEWEKFKGSGWSDDVQSELNALDQQFATIADGADAGMDMGLASPSMPMAPEAPIPPAIPPTPEVPAVDVSSAEPEVAPAPEPLPDEAAPAPPAEPLANPMASNKNAQINEKSNYELHDKKGSDTSSHLKKGDTHMANTTKPSLKEKLAEVKSKREAITKEAKTRVAAVWTIAKTMLPTAPADIQKSFAASLLTNSTKVIKAALRQTAINAHNTKLAETFKEVHKVELNDLLEDHSVLSGEKNAVKSELKGDAKNATSKKADDRKEAGPQEGTYDDGRHGSEPKEIDASKAGERPDAGEKPGQTQNLSDGKTAKAATCVGKDCKGCAECKKASKKTADEAPAEAPVEAPPAEAAAPAEEAAPEAIEAPAEMPPAVPENPEGEAAEILTDEKKQVLEEKIDEAQAAISAIEAEILEEGDEELDLAKLEGEEEALGNIEGEELEGDALGEGLEGEGDGSEELDFSKVFDEGAMEDKAASLANEGEDKSAGEEDDFFAPSTAGALEASMDDNGMGDMESMFSLQGSDGDPLASLIAGIKTAEQVAGMEVVESFSEAAKHFEQEEASEDGRDNETDHEGNLFFEALDSIPAEEQGAKRTPQDSTNKLEAPKAAKAAPTLKKIHTASGSDKPARRLDVGDVLFNDGFED